MEAYGKFYGGKPFGSTESQLHFGQIRFGFVEYPGRDIKKKARNMCLKLVRKTWVGGEDWESLILGINDFSMKTSEVWEKEYQLEEEGAVEKTRRVTLGYQKRRWDNA